jgi:hypothetical protein
MPETITNPRATSPARTAFFNLYQIGFIIDKSAKVFSGIIHNQFRLYRHQIYAGLVVIQ